jgi:glycerol-3-phosphate dehydrogenase
MNAPAEIDVAVFGGGIAGLWLLNRLRRLGFDALLFEKGGLGDGQTLTSQGIIHSGVKYGFDNVIRPQSQSLSSMPKIWMDCIKGCGEVDLRGTEILANHQFVFTMGGLSGRIAGAIASRAFRSASEEVEPGEYPGVFCAPEFRGKVFRLHEPVLATKTVITALLNSAAYFATVKDVRRAGESVSEIVLGDAQQTNVRPRACVFTSGTGNEWFAEQMGLDKSKVTQRRPLRMFLARGLGHHLYAHCLVPEPRPRVTITTHQLEGETVWYIGGNVAEKAVGRSDAEALHLAHSEMTEIFPGLDWKQAKWAIHDVDRAEPAVGKLLPSGPTLRTLGNTALGWPAKLALAPALAAQVIAWLEKQNISPSNKSTNLPLPQAEPGKYPWEQVRGWIQL